MSPNLLFVLRRRWPILVGLPLIVVALVVVLAPEAPKEATRYTTTVYLASQTGAVGLVDLQQAAVELKQPRVAAVAASKAGVKTDDPRAYAAKLRTKVDEDALIIRLSTQLTDRKQVLPYTRSFAEAFITVNQLDLDQDYQKKLANAEEFQLEAEKALNEFIITNGPALTGPNPDAALTTQRQLLQDRLTRAGQAVIDVRDARITSPYRIAGSDPVTTVSAAKLTLPQSAPVRAGLALVMSLLGAISLVAILEKVNPRIDSPKAAEDIVGAPVVAMVPVMKGRRRKVIERADLGEFTGPFAEAFRAMRSHLDFRSSAEGMERPPCVMIVSSAPAEGKTTTTAFLALSYAEVGREVVVIGADFRRPAVHRLFGVARTPGLSSRLLEDRTKGRPEDIVRSIVKRDEKTGVRVIPSGPGTDRVTGLLDDLAAVTSAGLDSGCTVVIDTVPVMVANDAVDFLPLVDWVVVVVRLGKTTERSLRQTMASLELNAAKVVGCVMVGSLESSDAKRYYYSYYRVDEPMDRPSDPAQLRRSSNGTGPGPALGSEAAAATAGGRDGGDSGTAGT
jgi:Mrp family chromosome partitioning ATPase